MPKIAGLRVPSVAAQQSMTATPSGSKDPAAKRQGQAHIDQLMAQAQRLKAEVARLEKEEEYWRERIAHLEAESDNTRAWAMRLKAEVARLEVERDAARKAARAWKRAAKDWRKAFKTGVGRRGMW